MCLSPLFIWAQIGASSPYSIFGIGEPVSTNLNPISHMGNLGASYADGYHINLTNPATLASLGATAFDVSAFTEYTRLNEGEQENVSLGGNIQYLSLAFPTRNPYTDVFERKQQDFKHAMGFSLIPHSLVGYNISTEQNIPDFGPIDADYTGSGGTYKFIVSNGVRYKRFSAGINLGYLFGQIRFSRDIRFNTLNSFDLNFENNYSVSGFVWNSGFLYSLYLNEKEVKEVTGKEPNYLNIGLTFGSNTSFNTNSNIINLNVQPVSQTQALIDTVLVAEDLPGKGTLPGEFNIGATYVKGNQLTVGFNYRQQFWSAYQNDADPTGQFSNSSMITFGGYYRPNYKSIDKYYQRIYYRFGFYYGNTPVLIDDAQINDVGVTFGFGLPFVYQKKFSHANIGFTLGRTGSGSLIEENFARLSFGFTFNDDEWFIKRKYN